MKLESMFTQPFPGVVLVQTFNQSCPLNELIHLSQNKGQKQEQFRFVISRENGFSSFILLNYLAKLTLK